MELKELKEIIDKIDLDRFSSQVFVIVGTPGEGRSEAAGVDIDTAEISFDNGGPVFVLTPMKDDEPE